MLILKRIGTTIALPFFVALFMQFFWKKGNAVLVRFTGATFYVWAFLLFLTLGQKNTAMAIWMANTYLNPLASVFLAFYSVMTLLLLVR